MSTLGLQCPSFSSSGCCDRSDDESDGEIDDETINKLIIVTQTPPSLRKHPGGDRTGDFMPRSKMTAELAKVINDGLYFYEQELWEQGTKVTHCVVMEHLIWIMTDCLLFMTLLIML